MTDLLVIHFLLINSFKGRGSLLGYVQMCQIFSTADMAAHTLENLFALDFYSLHCKDLEEIYGI